MSMQVDSWSHSSPPACTSRQSLQEASDCDAAAGQMGSEVKPAPEDEHNAVLASCKLVQQTDAHPADTIPTRGPAAHRSSLPQTAEVCSKLQTAHALGASDDASASQVCLASVPSIHCSPGDLMLSGRADSNFEVLTSSDSLIE